MAPTSDQTLREMFATLSERLTMHMKHDEEERQADREERARMYREQIERAEQASNARRKTYDKIEEVSRALQRVELAAAKASHRPLWTVLSAAGAIILMLIGSTAYLADRVYSSPPRMEKKP